MGGMVLQLVALTTGCLFFDMLFFDLVLDNCCGVGLGP